MADVPGKFFSATKVRTGVAPSSSGSIVGEPLPPVNPPGSSLNSVGLTMPSAFTVSNSPLTANGTIGVAGAGTVGQYIRGDGSLADFPATTGGGSSVSYYLNGSVSQGTIGGVAYKELNKTPIFGAGTDISINADGYIASFITDAGDPNKLLIPAGNWNFETYFSASSSGGTPSFYVELYKYNGTTFTLIATSSSAPELIAFGTNLNPYFSTLAVPETVLALTDRLALRYYVTHSGRTITLHTENNHLCQVITSFTTGLTALNGLTSQVQFFAVGTSGTDFAISSASDTHTFNLPTASATNRGALSSADWTTFNNKQNTITNPVTGTGASGQVAYWSSGSAITGESNLFWDATNDKLGIGTSILSSAKVSLQTNSDADALSLSGYQVLKWNNSNNLIFGGYVSNEWIAIRFFAGGSEQLQITTTGLITTNNVTAAQFIRSGGTSAQFLKADGSIDSNAYLTTSAAASTYLPLAGGTLTGALGGTTASFSGQIQAATLRANEGIIQLFKAGSFRGGLYTLDAAIGSGTDYSPTLTSETDINFLTGGSITKKLIIDSTGAATFSNLAGSGTRMVVASSTGLLSTQAITVGTVTSVAALTLGTSGTDLSSSVANGTTTPVITLNVPTASAANRGALSAADWTTFNSKENAISAGTTAQYYRGDKTFQTLNTAAVPELTNLYYTEARVSSNTDVAANTAARHAAVTLGVANGLGLTGQELSLGLASSSANGALSSTDWTTFNNKQNALTNPVTGTGTTNYLTKFTGASTIGNTNIINDSNGTLILGGTSSTGTAGTGSGRGNLILAGSISNKLTFNNDSTTVNGYVYSDGSELQISSGAGFMNFYTANGERLRIFTDGNVSISNSPSNAGFKLDVNGTGRFSDRLTINANSGANALAINGRSSDNTGSIDFFQNNGTTRVMEIGVSPTAAEFYYDANSPMIFYTNGTQRFRINSNGNVAISSTATNPTARLEISANAGVDVINVAGYDVLKWDSGDILTFGGYKSGQWNSVVLSTAGSPRLTIASTGAATFSSSVTSENLFRSNAGIYQIFQGGTFRGGLYNYAAASGSGTDYSPTLVSETDLYFTTGGSATKKLTISSTGAATFSSSVTANGNIRRRSTDSVFTELQADGVYATGTDLYLLAPASRFVSIYAGNAEAMRIFSGGNVRIGGSSVTDNGNKLRVDGNIWLDAPTSGKVSIVNSSGVSTTIGVGATTGYVGTNSDHQLDFFTNNNVLATLKTDGQFEVQKIKTAGPTGGTAQPWRLGSVATVSPTSPNRTIEVEVNGTTYYLHAKTTNN